MERGRIDDRHTVGNRASRRADGPGSDLGRPATLADLSLTGLASVTADGRVLYANRAWRSMTGATASCIEGRLLSERGVLPESMRSDVMGAIAGAAAGAAIDVVVGRTSVDLGVQHRLRGRLVAGAGESDRSAEILLNLDPCLAASEPEPSGAERDPVTDLSLRQGLYPEVEKALVAARRSAHVVAVLFIDLDGFKSVNDSLGHASGDRLLRTVARRTTEAVRGARVWRYGGDEFVVLLEGLVDPRVARSAADRILTNVARPVSIGRHEVTPTCSIGVALADGEVTCGQELVARADDAMYRAKSKGGGRVERFDRELAHHRSRVRSFEQELVVALDRGEMDIHYQPEFDLVSGAIVGVEALLRWRHAKHGLLSAGSFLPAALDLGLGADLASHVIDQVCRDVAGWRNRDVELDVRVNLSAVQIETSIVDRTLRAIQTSGVDASRFIFEIREPDQPSPAWGGLLTRLRDGGVRVALDHFGTGSLSIAHLRSLAIDSIKIDGGFLPSRQSSSADHDGDLVLAAMIQLATALGLGVSADRIECAGQKAALLRHGCRRGQGHFLASPQTADTVISMVEADVRRRASSQSSASRSAAISAPSSAAVFGPSSSSVMAFAE